MTYFTALNTHGKDSGTIEISDKSRNSQSCRETCWQLSILNQNQIGYLVDVVSAKFGDTELFPTIH